METKKPEEILKEIKELVDEVYDKKQAATAAEKSYNEAKMRLADIMEKSEVDKMQGDHATASLVLKSSASVPKEDHKKKALFEYIEKEHGKDVLLRYLTINARSFSKFLTEETERKVAEGEFDFKLPMVDTYDYYSVGLRKRTKRKE